jgi:hypothetical protein
MVAESINSPKHPYFKLLVWFLYNAYSMGVGGTWGIGGRSNLPDVKGLSRGYRGICSSVLYTGQSDKYWRLEKETSYVRWSIRLGGGGAF